MCEMRGYSPREFIRLLIDNGWRLDRSCGTHRTFRKDGEAYIVTFSEKGKELSRPLIQRVIKEAHLKT